MDEIELVLSRDHYPQLLKRYSLEDLKKMAIDMALAQYRERPLTAAMLYSCLANLEVDLERMFPPPKTPEQKAAAEEEADEEEQKYQERIAEMEPYLINGQQAEVNENGEFLYLGNPTGDWAYPVWKDQDGILWARVYLGGWDWLILENPEREEIEEEEDE